MRRLFAFALILLVLVSIPVAASIPVPRQVDPNSAPTDPVYGQGLYLFYGAIVTALTGGNFTAAKQLLAHTPFIHVPPEISDAVNSFNRLINATANLFTVIDRQIKNASGYVSTGRLAQARIYLQGAITNLRSANATITELFGAVPQLGALTGIPSSLLQQRLQPLRGLYTSYSAQAARLLKVITGASRLGQTFVSLAVAPKIIITGSNVTASGSLLGTSGDPLSSRSVVVYFENQAIGTIVTSGSGSFSAVLRTPFYYQKSASLFASFLPEGNDTLVYAPSTSTPIAVNVTFASPSVELLAPGKVFAGLSLRVNGSLSFGGQPLAGYPVSLSGFRGNSYAITSEDGSFSLRLQVPSGLGQGAYQVTLATGANGIIGPTSTTLRVFVVEENPSIATSIPIIVIAGLPFTVSGSATVNGTGLVGARVLNISPSPSVNTDTSEKGSFSFTVTAPLTASNGEWSYTAGMYPTQSWISPTQINVTVFVINPLVLVFPATSLGVLVLVVRRRRQPIQAQSVLPREEPEVPQEVPKTVSLTGLPAIYARAVELLEKATSVALLPQTTAREYLALTKGRFKGTEHLEYITSALETQLYGPGVSREVEERAAAELDLLRGELES